MKKIKLLGFPLLLLVFITSCTSIRVLSDYDQKADFKGYTSYAFYKTGLGSLYIDLIDNKTNELVWQGKGEGTLQSTSNVAKKEARIKEFVSQILEQYPPNTVALK